MQCRSVPAAFLLVLHVLLSGGGGLQQLLRPAAALSVDVARGATRCVSQELDPEDAAELQLQVSAPHAAAAAAMDPSSVIATELYHPDGRLLSRGSVAAGQKDSMKLAIDRSGAYKMCFHAPAGDAVSPLRVTFAVAIAASSSVSAAAEGRGPGAAALSTDAKDKMSLLESQFRIAEKKLLDITREIEFARRREEVNEDEETLFRLQLFGAASVLLLLATSVYQVYYLRSFFVSKKVL